MTDLYPKTRRQCLFSPDRAYRFRLDIAWDDSLPAINFIMLNPSVANEEANDPTVERCFRRALRWGYGRLIVTNLFALVSTDPIGLHQVDDPIGADNDGHIMKAASEASMVICAWGAHGNLGGRSRIVCDVLRLIGKPLHYLRMGKHEPFHPLYLRYDEKPVLWRTS